MDLAICATWHPTAAAASAALRVPFGAGCHGLSLTSDAPRVGFDWRLIASGVDPVSPFGVFYFGGSRQDPAASLPSLGLAAPDCFLNVGTVFGLLSTSALSGSASVDVAVPNQTALLGLALVAQSLALCHATFPPCLRTSSSCFEKPLAQI
jgi:hypothetical protein